MVYEIFFNGVFKEIVVVFGGNWGFLVINDEFINFIEDFIEIDIMKFIKENYFDDFFIFMLVFENKKRVFFKDDDRVIFYVFQFICDIMCERFGKLIEDYIEEIDRVQEVKFQCDKMYIYNEVFMKLLSGIIEKIVLYVIVVIELNKFKVDSIVFVGGFVECDFLKLIFRILFLDIRIFVLEDLVFVVLKGVVFCGRNF